jgi:hypothetical protein
MATGTGENVSKVVSYVQLTPPPAALAVSKVVNYVQLYLSPVAAAPLRYKKIPLTLDFATTTWDQQSRLIMYELYRSLGLDPTNAFLQTQYSWLAALGWVPPVTGTLTVWSEAVDPATWSILKQRKRGEIITLDPSVSPEWAAYGLPGYEGQYEIMETTYNPFQGDASQFASQAGGDPSTVIGSSTLASPSSQASGTIVLVLRTFNPFVLFDVSQTPSYANVPGPIIGDLESEG